MTIGLELWPVGDWQTDIIPKSTDQYTWKIFDFANIKWTNNQKDSGENITSFHLRLAQVKIQIDDFRRPWPFDLQSNRLQWSNMHTLLKFLVKQMDIDFVTLTEHRLLDELGHWHIDILCNLDLFWSEKKIGFSLLIGEPIQWPNLQIVKISWQLDENWWFYVMLTFVLLPKSIVSAEILHLH